MRVPRYLDRIVTITLATISTLGPNTIPVRAQGSEQGHQLFADIKDPIQGYELVRKLCYSSLCGMLMDGTYLRFRGIEGLADVVVGFNTPITNEDRKTFEAMGGVVRQNLSDNYRLSGGLPVGMLLEYAKRENVSAISPTFGSLRQKPP